MGGAPLLSCGRDRKKLQGIYPFSGLQGRRVTVNILLQQWESSLFSIVAVRGMRIRIIMK